MRIGVISDTHLREGGKSLPSQLIEAFRGVDLILHAGDIYVPEVLDELEYVAPVLAASGDDDYGAILTDKRVKMTHVLIVEGKTLWLVHRRPEYHPFKSRRTSGGSKGTDTPDIIVCGHTHYSIVECHDGILFVNPGSPMDPHPGLGTVAILDIDKTKVQAKALRLRAL